MWGQSLTGDWELTTAQKNFTRYLLYPLPFYPFSRVVFALPFNMPSIYFTHQDSYWVNWHLKTKKMRNKNVQIVTSLSTSSYLCYGRARHSFICRLTGRAPMAFSLQAKCLTSLFLYFTGRTGWKFTALILPFDVRN